MCDSLTIMFLAYFQHLFTSIYCNWLYFWKIWMTMENRILYKEVKFHQKTNGRQDNKYMSLHYLELNIESYNTNIVESYTYKQIYTKLYQKHL